MTRKQRRFTIIGLGLGVLAIAAALVFVALEDTIVFFYTPTDVVEKSVQPGTRFRLGGLVEVDSVEKLGGTKVDFVVTDSNNTTAVTFTGVLPDLFREGQGVIAEGVLDPSGRFMADSVLAKHDENYMPREVADSLKEQGVWQGEPETRPETQQ